MAVSSHPSGMESMGTSAHDPFGTLAEQYASCRPDYPPDLFTALRDRTASLECGTASAILDIGAGTGIATRMLRAAFDPAILVAAVEPSATMIDAALRTTAPASEISWVRGSAEWLPFTTSCAHVVLAAQAVQWFDRPAFYTEALRVLRPGGILAVLQNNREWQCSEFLNSYETLLERYSPGYSRFYRSFDVLAEFRQMNGLASPERLEYRWVRTVTSSEFVGLSLSSTKMKAAIDHVGAAEVQTELARLISSHANAKDELAIPYVSELFIGRRSDLRS